MLKIRLENNDHLSFCMEVKTNDLVAVKPEILAVYTSVSSTNVSHFHGLFRLCDVTSTEINEDKCTSYFSCQCISLPCSVVIQIKEEKGTVKPELCGYTVPHTC